MGTAWLVHILKSLHHFEQFVQLADLHFEYFYVEPRIFKHFSFIPKHPNNLN